MSAPQPVSSDAGSGTAIDLGQVALALSFAQTVDDVLDVVSDVTLPLTGADGLLLALVRTGELHLVRHSGYTDESVRALSRIALDAATPLAQTATGASAIFLPSAAAYVCRYPHLGKLAALTGKRAWAFLPLVVSRRGLGTLLVSYDAERAFPIADRAQLLALAGLCSQALEQARLLAGVQQVSVALQRALLPEALPQSADLRFAARYRPASQPEQVVGGDWYDAHLAEDGSYVLSIGDVVGHDIHAAALMGEVRHTLRAFASEGHGPSGVLHRVNRLLAGVVEPREVSYPLHERLATCFYLQLDPLSGLGTAVTAGHPQPIVLRAGERPRLLEVQISLPLGVLPDAALLESSAALLPGDVLLMYTDGLVEAPDVPVGDGIAALLESLDGLPTDDLERLADAVLSTCSDRSGDDVALLLVAYTPVLPPRRQVRRRFADEAVSVPLARSFTADVLGVWGLAGCDAALLITTELVTNAVAHTVGFCELSLKLTDGVLRVEVTDRSTRLPTFALPTDIDPDSEGGRGLVIVDVLADRFGVTDHGAGKTVWAELGVQP